LVLIAAIIAGIGSVAWHRATRSPVEIREKQLFAVQYP